MSSGKTSLVPLIGLRSSFSEAALGVAPPPTRLSASWSTAALALPPPAPPVVAGGAGWNVVVITEVHVGRQVLCHHGVVLWFVGLVFRCCLVVWCCGAVLLGCGGFRCCDLIVPGGVRLSGCGG